MYPIVRRAEHYDWLGRVRTDGDWEGWMRFFPEGVIDVAGNAVSTAKRLTAMVEPERERIAGVGRGAATALRVHEAMECARWYVLCTTPPIGGVP